MEIQKFENLIYDQREKIKFQEENLMELKSEILIKQDKLSTFEVSYEKLRKNYQEQLRAASENMNKLQQKEELLRKQVEQLN